MEWTEWLKIFKKIESAPRDLKSVLGEEMVLDEKTIVEEESLPEEEKLPESIEHTLLICREQVAHKGEDFYLAKKDGGQLLMGVFDGCGGSGAKVYPQLGGQTGARVASRTLAKAVEEWLTVKETAKEPEEKCTQEHQEELIEKQTGKIWEEAAEKCAEEIPKESAEKQITEKPEEELHKIMKEKLVQCQAAVQTGQVLLGSLKKEFPSTMVLFTVPKEETHAEFFWCGDSRGYVLDAEGLHQVTTDDVAVTDAMENLREDAPMTNVANASVPFVVHRKSTELNAASLLIAATDGCFGYLTSPMEFEKLLLRTMAVSEDMEQWRTELEKEIGKVAGDDFTLAIWNGMFGSFQEMKDSFGPRLQYVEAQYPLDEQTTEKILNVQWKEYKTSYESLMDVGEVKHGN